MSNVTLVADPAGSLADAHTLHLAQEAYDSIVALDTHLAGFAPNGSAYAKSEAGSSMLRAYFAVVEAVGAVGIVMAED